MKRLAALLIFLAAPLLTTRPALAANDETPTILRGTPAPPPPAVVEVPVYYPQPVYYYALPVHAGPLHAGSLHAGSVRPPVVIHHHHFRH